MLYKILTLALLLLGRAFVLTAQPVAGFTSNKTSGCSPLTIQFTDVSTGSPEAFEWDFGNGNTSVIQSPSATYVTPGTYTVSLRVSNASGTTIMTKTAYITVFKNPLAEFYMSVSGGCAPLNVSFVSTSTPGSNPITQYLWDYGDGNLNTSQSTPVHTYVASGIRTLSLTVTDANGCQNTVTKVNAINVTQTHTVNFTGTNLFSCNAPLVSSFTSTVSPLSGNYTYLWTTSNGLTSTQQNPQFVFNNTGEFDVTLKVTNPTGCSESVTKTKVVSIPRPLVNFTASATSACVGNTINFTNTTTPDTSSVSYRWYVNSIAQATTKNYTFSTNVSGTYVIMLEATDRGCKASKQQTITVSDIPKASFTAVPPTFCTVPSTVNFINSSTPSGLNYSWDFGNGQTSSAKSPSATYTIMGKYPVKLLVTSSGGCTDTASFMVKSADPEAEIVAKNAKMGCAPLNTTFRLIPGQAKAFASFEWRLKGTVLSTDSQFNYTFPDTGIHIVTFKAVTADGCEVLLQDTVKVGFKYPFNFVGDKREGCFNNMKQAKFTSIGSGPDNLVYEWFWGPFKSIEKDPTLVFNDTGVYDVTLRVWHYGCMSERTLSNYVIIHPARAAFREGTISCASDSVSFDNLSVGQNKYWWSFGDGNSSTLTNPKHIFPGPGVYQVRLVALDTVHNCPDTITRQVVIPDAPKLNFSMSDTLGCAPLNVTFKNLTVIGPNGYPIVGMRWDFSGKPSSSLNTPIVLFDAPGYVRVTLRVTDQRNCTYVLIKDSAVHVIGGTAAIGLQKDRGCIPFTTQISDNSVTEFPVVKRKWIWSATDSIITTSGGPTPRTFTDLPVPQGAGQLIRLVVTDAFGCQFSGERRIYPSQPSSYLNFTRTHICGSQSVTFRAPATDTLVYMPARYAWTVGNLSSTASSLSVNYNYTDTVLPVRLKITDANNCSVTTDTNISIINKKPLAGFYATPSKLDCYKPVRPIRMFDTTVVGATQIKKWLWKVGPNISDKKNPEFVFPVPGEYGVKLWIEDSAGCVDSVLIPDYVVIGGPKGSYGFTPKRGCMPHKVGFTVTSPNARYYIWDLADGYVDTVENATFEYAYPREGVYYPRLTLIDSSGTCAFGYDAIDSIVVHPLPKPDFDVDKSVVCVNSAVTFTNKTPNAGRVKNWFWLINDADTLKDATPAPRVFSSSGRYKVSLMAKDVNACVASVVKPDIITVVDDTIPPATPNLLRATVTDNTSTHVRFLKNNEMDFLAYKIYYNYIAGNPANKATQSMSDTEFVHTPVNTLENTYSYAVAAVDVCNNISLPGELHTTVELKTMPTLNAVMLKWTPYAGFDTIEKYEIWRNNADSGTTFIHLNNVAGNVLEYADTTITCFTQYYYRIKTVQHGGDKQFSWSDTSGATPEYVPTMPSTRNIRATVVNDNHILLQWNKRTHKIPFVYLIYRMRDDEKEPVAYRQLTDTFLIDNDVDVDHHSYTYYTYLKDHCGGLSPASNQSKTILLKVNLKENDLLKHDPVIDFTSYQHWNSGVKKYEADFYYDSAGAFSHVTTLEPTDTQFFHKYVNLQQRDYCYKVTAHENEEDGTTSESNIACIDTKPRLYAPSAFTINGDGLNDKFELGGVFLDSYHLKIYTRWGELVFESKDIHNSWDGTINGKPAVADVYVYIAEGTGRHNQHITLKGNVTLLK
jgi:gliding motility-associated-like protein